MDKHRQNQFNMRSQGTGLARFIINVPAKTKKIYAQDNRG